MALRIETKNGRLDLEAGYSIEIEDTNPMYNDRGSQSLSAPIPATRDNLKNLGYWSRLDNETRPMGERVQLIDGVYMRSGKMNISGATPNGSVMANIGFDESELYEVWSQISLRTLNFDSLEFDSNERLIEYLNLIMRGLSNNIELTLFPIYVGMQQDNDGNSYYDVLNKYKVIDGKNTLISEARVETLYINNTPVETQLPQGYGISPFLKVNYIIDRIFFNYGYRLIKNPFNEHPQLKNLVVLNNAADCCVGTSIKYSDLLPDCTVNEFLNSICARFGLIYYIDGQKKEVRIKFIKDIINDASQIDLSSALNGYPSISYENAQQLKLSAYSNIKGPIKDLEAKAANENLDNFLAVYDYRMNQTNVTVDSVYHSIPYGVMLRRNPDDARKETLSSDFFNWDRCGKMAYKEANSNDENLPLWYYEDNGSVWELAPCFLFNKLHKYTLIESGDIEISENVSVKTPLSFCFSWRTMEGSVFGSPRCWDAYFRRMYIDDTPCDISLINITDDGLYSRFWKDYDAVLRWSNHIVEAEFNLDLLTLQKLDLSKPVMLKGQRLMIDSLRYTLPAKGLIKVKAKLRKIGRAHV